MKKLIGAMSTGICAALTCMAVTANPLVTFSPSAQHVNVGDTVSIDVSISGLGAEILSGFDLRFKYSPSILGFSLADGSTSVAQLGGAYGLAPFVDFDTSTNGDLHMFASAFEDDSVIAANQLDSFLLFHFDFVGASAGVTLFGLGPDLFLERNFVGLKDAAGNPLSLTVDIGSACVAVGTGQCTVPEPTSYALVGLGLFAAFAPTALRRRKTAA